MSDIKLNGLSHRMLLEKMREDLLSLERNLDIVYVSGPEKIIRYTNALMKYANELGKITDSAYSRAIHEVLIDGKSLRGIVTAEVRNSE